MGFRVMRMKDGRLVVETTNSVDMVIDHTGTTSFIVVTEQDAEELYAGLGQELMDLALRKLTA